MKSLNQQTNSVYNKPPRTIGPLHKNRKKILTAIESIPAFPKSAQDVLRLTQDPDCSPKDLVQVLRHDPIFTLKILKVVNSPFIGLLQPIHSIQQAAVYLGLNTLKHMALNLATINVLKTSANLGFSWQKFWWHSLSVAVISKQLTTLLNFPVKDKEEFFSAGLLHDIGKLVLAFTLPESFALTRKKALDWDTMLYEVEKDEIGFNHAEVGGMLARKWDFPESLACGIANHHTKDETMTPLAICVFTANQISKIKTFGFAGESKVEIPSKFIADHFHMEIAEIINHIMDVETELNKAKAFISA